MSPVDQRNRLNEEPFAYRASKDGTLFILWHGKRIKMFKAEQAQKILARLAGADAKQIQLVLAKATGHFKHGNER